MVQRLLRCTMSNTKAVTKLFSAMQCVIAGTSLADR